MSSKRVATLYSGIRTHDTGTHRSSKLNLFLKGTEVI
jgi:hypothetical protein